MNCSEDIFSRVGFIARFAKDEEIYGEGEAADHVYRMVSGTVRTSRFMADGRRPIGDFYYQGDVFGLELGKAHEMAAEALSDCVVLAARRDAIVNLRGADALQTLMLESTKLQLTNAREHLSLLVRKSASERVASFLLGMARRSGANPIELVMGRQDIADYLGLTIETVSRMITQLQGTGVVQFESCRRFRICDREALVELAAA